MNGIRYFLNDVRGNIEIKKCNNSVHSYKTHFHDEVSIGLIEKGCSKSQICNKYYELTDKTFLIIPSNVTHKCSPYDYNNWKFRMFYIDRNWFERQFNIQSKNINFSYIKLGSGKYLKLVKLLNDIQCSKIDIENESRLLLGISSLLNKNNSTCSMEKSFQYFNPKKMSEVKEYLDDNYLKDIKLIDLAKIGGMSKYYIIKKFDEYYGLSPHQYIMNLRINYAKNLLKNNMDITDAALESGFYDQSHFTRYFKEYTGVTPTNYKANLKPHLVYRA